MNFCPSVTYRPREKGQWGGNLTPAKAPRNVKVGRREDSIEDWAGRKVNLGGVSFLTEKVLSAEPLKIWEGVRGKEDRN